MVTCSIHPFRFDSLKVDGMGLFGDESGEGKGCLSGRVGMGDAERCLGCFGICGGGYWGSGGVRC